jgi:hypothetical protein
MTLIRSIHFAVLSLCLCIINGCTTRALLHEIRTASTQQNEFVTIDDVRSMPENELKAFYGGKTKSRKGNCYLFYLQGVLKSNAQRILALNLPIDSLGACECERVRDYSFKKCDHRDSTFFYGRILGEEIETLPKNIVPVSLRLDVLGYSGPLIDSIPLKRLDNEVFPGMICLEPRAGYEERTTYIRIGYKIYRDSSDTALCLGAVDTIKNLKWESRDKEAINAKKSEMIFTVAIDIITYPFQLLGKLWEEFIFAVGMGHS